MIEIIIKGNSKESKWIICISLHCEEGEDKYLCLDPLFSGMIFDELNQMEVMKYEVLELICILKELITRSTWYTPEHV